MWLFVAFLAVPLIEITLFIQIGGAIGLGWTLATVVVTAILGTILVRNQGSLALSQVRSSFAEVRDPTESLVHGAMILFSGALLLTPGFFTDGIGFLLLIPAVRASAYKFLRTQVQVASFSTHQTSQQRSSGVHDRQNHRPQDDIIDAEYVDVTASKPKNRGPSGWTDH